MSDICPALGLADDKTLMRSEPDPTHRCYAVVPPGTRSLDHQNEYCLAAKHSQCPYFSPAALSSPVPTTAWIHRRRARSLIFLVLAGVLVLIGVYGGGLLRAPAWLRLPSFQLPALRLPSLQGLVNVLGAAPAAVAPATPIPFTVTPSATPSGTRLVQPTQGTAANRVPTPEPGGREQALVPRSGDAGWWSSAGTRGNLGDSFLYAGFYQGQAFVSAVRFDLGGVPRDASIHDAAVVLTGLSAERLNPTQGGTWSVQLLALPDLDNLRQRNFQEVYNATAGVTLFPALLASDIGQGHTNVLVLDAAARDWLAKQILKGTDAVIMRISGPASGDNLFAWDGGTGPATLGAPPRLVLDLGPAPIAPPPLPTDAIMVVTLTPTPANVLTVAAGEATAQVLAALGTPTPMPYRLVTATPFPADLATAQAIALALGLPPIVPSTATPANSATATFQALYATAVAMTTGTFTPVPANAVTPFVITPTVGPNNVMTAAAALGTPTAVGGQAETMTPLPYNAVVATLTETPYVYLPSPTPANAATALAIARYATAVAATTGTFTPMPENAVMATRTPTPTAQGSTPTVAPPGKGTPQAGGTRVSAPAAGTPAALKGKILFMSDRSGAPAPYSYDTTSREWNRLAQDGAYNLALQAEVRAPDGHRILAVAVDGNGVPQIYVHDDRNSEPSPLTWGGAASYDAVWSPTSDLIAFVSDEPGNGGIFTIRPDGSDRRRLTVNDGASDKHPTWSPDGKQIVFWSNRNTGRRQLWIMNADGSKQRALTNTPYNDWDPIWMK